MDVAQRLIREHNLTREEFVELIKMADDPQVDALLADDRIIGLKNYEYSINGQNLTVSFTVETVYGDVETGTEVKF